MLLLLASGGTSTPTPTTPEGIRIGGITGLTLSVEAAFGSGPLDASPNWVDISDHVMGISTRRGRNTARDEYQPGSAQIRLKNLDRRFDPTYDVGPYWVDGATQIVPMVPIRIRALKNAVLYPIWYGFADEWVPSYEMDRADGTGVSYVDLTATDAFKVLGVYQLPDSVWAATIIAEQPSAWWRFGEQAGDQMVDSSGNGWHGFYRNGGTERSVSGLIPYSADPAINFDTIVEAQVNATTLSSRTFTIEGWFAVVPQVSDASLFRHGSGGTGSVNIAITSALSGSFFRVTVADSDINYRTRTTVTSVADDQVHHFMVCRSGNAIVVYLDGTEVDTEITASGSITGASSFGTTTQIGYGNVEESIDGPIDEIAIYNDEFKTLTDAVAHYDAAVRPWDQDRTGERVGRILDLVGWPSALRDLDAGTTFLGPAVLNDTASTSLGAVARVERGAMFVDKAGQIRFRDRTAYYTDTVHTTVQATFGDRTAGEIPYSGVEFDYSDVTLVNQCRVNTEGGRAFLAEDPTSVARYGTRSLTLSVPEVSDAYASALAEHEVLLGRNPHVRVTSLRIPTSRVTDATGTTFDVLNAIATLELGYRVRVHRYPPGGGGESSLPIEQDCHVEQIAHQITPTAWTTTLWLSPADPYSYVVVGSSVVGSNDIVGY